MSERYVESTDRHTATGVYTGTASWLTNHWHVVRSFPDPDDEPIRRKEFPEPMRDEFVGLWTNEIIEAVDTVDDSHGRRLYTMWRVRPSIRDYVERNDPPSVAVTGTSPLPCACPVFKIHNHGDEIECLECRGRFPRDEVNA